MKLVDFTELMEMPVGTIFQEFGKFGLGVPHVFGGTQGDSDYIEAVLLPYDNSVDTLGNNAELFKKYGLEGREYGIWYPSGFGRDGSYDKNRHYLIWEKEDRKKLAEWLLNPTKAVDEMNDDPHALIQVDWDIRAPK